MVPPEGDSHNKSHHWGRVPLTVVQTGALRRMGSASARVYLALCLHANRHFQSRPGVRRLAESTGLTSRSVERALTNLVHVGAIRCQRPGGGRAMASVWQIVHANPDGCVGVSETETPTGVTETPTGVSRNPDGRVGPTEYEQTMNSMQAAGAAPDVESVMRAMARFGIHRNRKTIALAASPGMSPDLVATVCGRAGPKAGPGLLVTRLREAVEGTGEAVKAEQAERERRRRLVAEAVEASARPAMTRNRGN